MTDDAAEAEDDDDDDGPHASLVVTPKRLGRVDAYDV